MSDFAQIEPVAEPSTWPIYRRVTREPIHGKAGIRSWPSSLRAVKNVPGTTEGIQEEAGIRSLPSFVRAVENAPGSINVSEGTHEELFLTVAGIPLWQQRVSNAYPSCCSKPCCGSTIAQVSARCYVVCFTLLLATWACSHARFTFIWFTRYSREVNLGMVLYWLAFSLPSFDSLFNLGFTAYQLHEPQREDAEMHETGHQGSVSWNVEAPQRPLWFRLLSLFVLMMVFSRAGILLFLCSPTLCTTAAWVQGPACVMESLPLLASSLAMYGNTNVMLAKLKQLGTKIIDRALPHDRCVCEYKQFQEFVRARSQRWQILIVVSTSIEIYIICFQTLWCLKSSKQARYDLIVNDTLVSCYVMLIGVYIIAKLLPLALFNYKIKIFAHDLVITAQDTEEELMSNSGDPEQVKNFREVVSTMSLLFSTEPPCLKVLNFVIDNNILARLVISVVLTSMSRFFVDLAEGA